MLVLSRREGERIKIGDSITVTVVRCIGDKVRIGIEAPSDMLILRGELEQYDKGVEKGKRNETPAKKGEPVPTRMFPGAPVDYPMNPSVPTTVF